MKIQELSDALQEERKQWRENLHPHVKSVIGHIHPPLLDSLLHVADHRDKLCMKSLMAGRAPLGCIEPAGLYRQAVRLPKVPLAKWLKEAPGRNSKMLAQVGPSGDDELDRQSWAKREQEIATGAVRGPFRVSDVSLSEIAIHPSFAVWERAASGGWKARNIDNMKASEGNDTVETTEAYTPDDLDRVRAVVRLETEMWTTDAIAGFKSDYRGAFR